MRNTVFGRYIFALGTNETAARLCGIRVQLQKTIIYTVAGLFFGLAGLMQLSRLTQGDPTVAIGLELDIIAAVVIGGASLNGGVGSIAGSMIGAFTMAILRNGSNQMGWPTYMQEIIIGVVIILAVGVDKLRQRGRKAEAVRQHEVRGGLAKLAAQDLTYRMTDDLPEAYRGLQADFNQAMQQLEAAMQQNPDVKAVLIQASESSTGSMHDLESMGRLIKQTSAIFIARVAEAGAIHGAGQCAHYPKWTAEIDSQSQRALRLCLAVGRANGCVRKLAGVNWISVRGQSTVVLTDK